MGITQHATRCTPAEGLRNGPPLRARSTKALRFAHRGHPRSHVTDTPDLGFAVPSRETMLLLLVKRRERVLRSRFGG